MSKNQTKITEKSEKKMTDKPVKRTPDKLVKIEEETIDESVQEDKEWLMNQPNVKLENKINLSPKCIPTVTSLKIDESISREDLCTVGLIMLEMKVKGSLMWWIGDFCLFSEKKFNHMIIDDFYSVRTVRNAKWVCKRIEPSRRRVGLSFGHHQAVAPFPPKDQDEWLKCALWNRWTVKDLRYFIKEKKLKALAKKNDEDAEMPISFEGGYHYLPDFLRTCTEDIKRLNRKLRAIAEANTYMHKGQLSFNKIKDHEAKREFLEHIFVFSHQLNFFLMPFEKDIQAECKKLLDRGDGLIGACTPGRGRKKKGNHWVPFE